MPSWTFDTPPTWASNAIATDRGWVDPKTGEVLVSCTRLNNATPYSKRFHKGGKPKSMRGGARPGAGRPPKKKDDEPKTEESQSKSEDKQAPAKKAPAKKKAAKKKAPAKKTEAKVETPAVTVSTEVKDNG